MKSKILKMMESDYEGFVKALISIETGEQNLDNLEEIYQKYFERDDMTLLHEEFYTL